MARGLIDGTSSPIGALGFGVGATALILALSVFCGWAIIVGTGRSKTGV